MRARKHHQQLDLMDARKPDGKHGGWRPRAGRKRRETSRPHVARARVQRAHPCHVTLRVIEGVRLRSERVLDAIRAAIEAGHREDFRVTHFNVLGNHIHLVTEQDDERALARGMQGLKVRIAKAVNRALGRSGTIFAERYHARALTSPREVRNVLRYVLCNARHHAADRGARLARTWIDPNSSAPWFDGWRDPIVEQPWLRRLLRRLAPVAPARTWLLTEGWRRHGLLAFDEIPGEVRPRPDRVAIR